MTVAERIISKDNAKRPLPLGAFLSNDKRITTGIEEYLQNKDDSKRTGKIIRHALNISHKFARFFDVINDINCIGRCKKGNRSEISIFFKPDGVNAIINSVSIKELEMKKGTIHINGSGIKNGELIAMQYALRKLRKEEDAN